jgi:hypothetical protein
MCVAIKRGVIVVWSQQVGQIRNLINKDERLFVAREEVVEGVGRNMEQMVEERDGDSLGS